MTPLVPFVEVYAEPCPKCRDNSWNLRWFPERGMLSASPGGATPPARYVEPEHLRLSCWSCGYGFDMETADAARAD